MATDERMSRAPKPWETTTRIFIVIGFFAAIVGGVLYEVRREWDSAVLATLIPGVVITILCIALNIEWVLRTVIQKKMLLNLNTIVMVVFGLGITVGVNYYSYRHHAREDASGRYKLSEQTKNMLTGLENTVRAYTFFSTNARAYQDFQFVEMAKDVIEEYAALSTNMEVQHVDVMREGKNVMYVRDGLGVDSIDLNSVIFASGDLSLMDAKAAAGKALAYAEAKNQIEEQIDEFKARGISSEKLKEIRERVSEQLAEIELTGREKADIKDTFPDTHKALEGFFDGKDLTKDEITKIRDGMPKVKIRTKVVRGYDMYDSQQGGPGRGGESQPVFKGEEEFTTAVMSVADEKPAQVYFLTGHGERRTEGWDELSYRFFSEELKKSNVEFKTLDLNEEGKVPDDCAVLVIAGPANGIPVFHLRMIEAYLGRKTSADVTPAALLALVDPVQRRESGLQELLAKYNIDLLERVRLINVRKARMLDPRTFKVVTQERPSLNVEVSEYGDHRAVAALDGFPSSFADVACVRPAEKGTNADIKVIPFLNSNPKAWGETNFRKLVQSKVASFEADEDIKGPVPFGVIAESSKEEGPRLIVIGDADFGSSSFINRAAGNRGLAINSTLWLARKDNRLGLPPVDMNKASWQLTSDNQKTLGLVARFGLPAGWIFFGLGVWMIRAVMTTNSDRKSLALRFACVFGVLLAILGGIGYASDTTTGLTTGLIVLGIILVAVGIGFNLSWFKQMAIERKAVFGTNVAVMVVLGFVITFIVNYSAARSYDRLDVTENKRYALDDETISELEKVDQPIDATVIMPVQFFSQVAYFASMHMKEMQEEFRRHAPNVAFHTIYNTKDGQEQIRLLSEQLKTRFTRE
ncbi:MAG: Gldg family protein, partial [Planctomycetota bacterium]|nr:Gldg family protein [Planctomycetota bacterium]